MSDFTQDAINTVKKVRKKQQLAMNKFHGRVPEVEVTFREVGNGNSVRKIRKGGDLLVTTRDAAGRVTGEKIIEVKSSRTAPLSKLQKKMQKKNKNYEVDRSFSLP